MRTMEYDAIIIGAGAAGLASAVKLSCRGKKILLIEKQPVAGGFSTTFNRKGFVFESALHCVDGLQEAGEVRKFIAEYGIDKKINFIELTNFSRIIYPEHDFTSGFDHGHLIDYLKEKFPHEKSGITRLFLAFDKYYRHFDRFYNSKLPSFLKLTLTPILYPEIIRTAFMTADQFISKHIKDVKLKGIITDIWSFIGLPPSRVSAFYYLIVFRGYYYLPTFYIKGSSSELFKAMVEKIRENGSEVKFNTEVSRIVTEGGKTVKAIVTDKGEIFNTRVVISNANPIDTFDSLIDNAVIKGKYRKKLSGLEKSISATQVYLGLSLPAKDLGMDHFMFSINTNYSHEEDLSCCLRGDYDHCSLSLVDHAQVEPVLVPNGKGSLLIMVMDSYDNWDNLSPEEYKAKKQEAAKKLIKRAEEYLPGLTRAIEVMEIATPKTMERYGSSPRGAIYGFAQTPEQSVFRRLPLKTDVRGLFLTGAWTQPGAGIHACFISGMDVASLALKLLK
ncbi:MAG: NAD(P)/FAD-dependent oxidoreductase [Candidatus Omnitrophota bacterium]